MNNEKKTTIKTRPNGSEMLVYDIDVPDGVETVNFYKLIMESSLYSDEFSVDLTDIKKQFPDVKKNHPAS